MDIIQKAISQNQKTLSEYDSKKVIASAGVPVTREMLAQSVDEAMGAAAEFGYPVVLKGVSHELTHKTEMGAVKLNIKNDDELRDAYNDIVSSLEKIDGVLVQEMIKGNREFVIGLTRDPQFGPCVMFGLGGIFTEVLKDVTFRVAPLSRLDAEEMINELKTRELLDEFRGSPAVDRDLIIEALMGIGELGDKCSEIKEIDINPLIIDGNRPVAVDALVVLNN